MTTSAINDLCHIRDNLNCTAFTSDELCQLIEYFCLRWAYRFCTLFIVFLCRPYRPTCEVFFFSMFCIVPHFVYVEYEIKIIFIISSYNRG